MSRNSITRSATPEKIAETARRLREADALEKQERAIMTAFCDQMVWSATVDGLQEEYGLDASLVTPRGKSRWTNHGVFEGPVSIVGLHAETRAVLTRVDDEERFMGYRTERNVRLVRRNFFGTERPLSRLEIAKHLEKVSRKNSSR